MKRSSCLSALLVGLSLTTASAALAAPPTATDKQPVKRVAQAQDPSSDTTAASGNSPTTQPAVSVGTSPTTTPAKDTPAESEPEPAAKPAPRPFAGSALYTQNSMTTNTVFRGQTQSPNPTVESNLFILPRYAFNDALQLRGRVIINYEYTNSDTTTYRNEPLLSDTTLSLFYRKLPKLPLGVIPNLALNVAVPTSKLSRSRTMLATPGATLQLVRPFEHILGGEGMLFGSIIYSHPIYESRNPVVVDPRPAGAFSCVGGGNCSDLLSGTMNPSDTLSYFLLFEVEWGHFSPAIYYLGATQWAYQPQEVRNPVDGTPVGRPEGFEPTSVRQTHYFSAWLDYNFNSWFTGEVGYWNSTTALNGAGQRANPIFSQYADTRVYLGASIQLDNLVKAIQGGDHGEAGIVRAKNTKQPMWNF
ncbi:MAG: hypothetical protein KF764_07150 [Labilithrix sp.]|nr:hypothetical protein [Labilithrix sp.]MBX3220211.1 hypothetical protein [Labilithrix sp.]